MQTLQVLEYQWIGKGEAVCLSDAQLALLDRLTTSLPANAVEWQRNRFRFCGYCGVLQLGELTLEVVPKIHGTETAPGKARELLVRMLAVAQNLELHTTGAARINVQEHVLLDIFILAFAEKLQALLRRGLAHSYIQREESLPLVRGKIAIAQQLRINCTRLHRMHCRYDEFLADTLHNQIVKVTLGFLSPLARSPRVQRTLEQLGGVFVDISDHFPTSGDWERLFFDRTNEPWREILELCRWFLQGMSPDVMSGTSQAISLLFSMPLLFERYLAIELKRALADSFEVLIQRPQRKLLQRSDGVQRFTMKPDLYVQSREGARPVAILDTKWKLLNGEERTMGVSQADVYQMYAYAGSYQVSRVMLLYPRQAGLEHLTSQWKFVNEERIIEIVQIDLEWALRGRRTFRRYLQELFMPRFAEELMAEGN